MEAYKHAFMSYGRQRQERLMAGFRGVWPIYNGQYMRTDSKAEWYWIQGWTHENSYRYFWVSLCKTDDMKRYRIV